MLKAGSPAPDLELAAPGGSPARLSSAWADRPAVLVFIRHFGCVFCRQQVIDLRASFAQFEAAGVNLVLVTQGDPAETREFIAKYRWPGAALCDPSRSAYAAYGLGTTTRAQMAHPSLLAAAGRAALQGTFQGRTHGGQRNQMPGLFIVDTTGVIRYVHHFRHPGDQPRSRDLLRILRDTLPEPRPDSA